MSKIIVRNFKVGDSLFDDNDNKGIVQMVCSFSYPVPLLVVEYKSKCFHVYETHTNLNFEKLILEEN